MVEGRILSAHFFTLSAALEAARLHASTHTQEISRAELVWIRLKLRGEIEAHMKARNVDKLTEALAAYNAQSWWQDDEETAKVVAEASQLAKSLREVATQLKRCVDVCDRETLPSLMRQAVDLEFTSSDEFYDATHLLERCTLVMKELEQAIESNDFDLLNTAVANARQIRFFQDPKLDAG